MPFPLWESRCSPAVGAISVEPAAWSVYDPATHTQSFFRGHKDDVLGVELSSDEDDD